MHDYSTDYALVRAQYMYGMITLNGWRNAISVTLPVIRWPLSESVTDCGDYQLRVVPSL